MQRECYLRLQGAPTVRIDSVREGSGASLQKNSSPASIGEPLFRAASSSLQRVPWHRLREVFTRLLVIPPDSHGVAVHETSRVRSAICTRNMHLLEPAGAKTTHQKLAFSLSHAPSGVASARDIVPDCCHSTFPGAGFVLKSRDLAVLLNAVNVDSRQTQKRRVLCCSNDIISIGEMIRSVTLQCSHAISYAQYLVPQRIEAN